MKKDIILDFTSLLDVTLIVVFFFVLFSHLDLQENDAKVQEKTHELEVAIQEANARETQAKSLTDELENQLQLVSYASERNGSNVSEILEFNKNQNLKILLDIQDNIWGIRVISNGESVSYLEKDEDIVEGLMSAIEKAGYVSGDTIFCDFIYDGSAGGSRSAYITIRESLDKISESYQFMYVSETDLSIGKG